jgi:hypothetical protein
MIKYKHVQLDEGALSIADTGYALRFLKLLVTNWKDTAAFKEGLIDDKGKRLKDVKIVTKEQKAAYTIFHRLVYNIKRLTGGNKFTSIVSALFLIKEETGMSDEAIEAVLDALIKDVKAFERDEPIEESYIDTDERLFIGTYILNQDIAHKNTGDYIAKKNTKVEVTEHLEPIDTLFGYNIYEVVHTPTKQKIYITTLDIRR